MTDNQKPGQSEAMTLKPCPFCGAVPTLSGSRMSWDCWIYDVSCLCGAKCSGDTKAEVITAWNTRTTASDEAIVEAAATTIFHIIKHGDAEHQRWLLEKSKEAMRAAIAAAAPMIRAQAMSDVADWLRRYGGLLVKDQEIVLRTAADMIDRGEIPATPTAGGAHG